MNKLPGNPALDRPSSGLEIDWAHPISRGLFDCLLFAECGIPRNLAIPSVVTSVTNTIPQATFSTTVTGPSVRMTSQVGAPNQTNYYSLADHGNIVAGDFAVRIRVVLHTASGSNYNGIFSKGAAGGNAEFAIYFHSANIGFVEVGKTTNVTSAYGSFVANVPADIICSRSGSTTTFYNNGISIGTSGVLTGATGSTSVYRIGGDGVNDGPITHYSIFQTWRRALSQQEVIQLFYQPYLGIRKKRLVSTTTAVAPSFISGWSRGSNLPVLGTGTF